MTIRHWFAGVAIAASVALAGCGGGTSDSAPTPAGAPRAGKAEPVSAAAAQLAKLPAADKTIAEAQKVCPISGESLGSMGVPPKVILEGETVFLCCKGCVADAEADPDKTLKTTAANKADAGAK